MRKFAVGLLVGLLSLVASTAFAAASPYPIGSVFQLPGPPVGAHYSPIKGELPKAPQCEVNLQGGCEVRDHNGMVLYLSWGADGPRRLERFVWKKVAELGVKLPLGLEWSDSRATILRKLAARGVKLHFLGKSGSDEIVTIPFFIEPKTGIEVSIELIFRNDRLIRVSEETPYP